MKLINGKQNTMKGIILGVILGTVLTGSIAVTAVTLTAKDVKYTPSNENFAVTNASEAIDELYNMSSELVGKSKVIDLGTGTSFDLTSYEGYESFTVDNFIIVPESLPEATGKNSNSIYASAIGARIYDTTFVSDKTYSEGVLTITVNTVKAYGSAANITAHAYSTPVCRAYLIK